MHFELELTQPFQTAAILQWLVVAGGSFFPFPKPNLRISTKMCSKSEQNFSFVTKPQLLILRQTVANIFPIINISNINKFWVGLFSRQVQINQIQVYWTGVS